MKKTIQGSLHLLVLLFLVLLFQFKSYGQTSTQKPVITCPANMIVGNGKDICGAYVTYAATATGSAKITYSIAPGNYFGLGTVNVTAIATNPAGSSSCTFNVTVIDNQLPICTAPSGVTIKTGESILPANTFMATARDNCSFKISITYTDDVDLGNCAGTIIRTWKATDEALNSGTATQIITVVDKQAPVIVSPVNQTLNLNANCSAVLPDYRKLLIASDNCTPANLLVITQSPAAGTIVSAAGTQTVNFTVADAYGNVSNATITVTKKDITPPVISLMSPVTVNNTAKSCGVVVNYAAPTSVDNCIALAFTNFSAGKPDNKKDFGGPDEDYIRLYSDVTWDDIRGDYTFKSIIEINTPNSATPNNYTLIGTFEGHTYFKSNFTSMWVNARAAAIAVKGDLVSINSIGENNFLTGYGGDVWVGGYHDHSAADFATPGNAAQNFGGWKWVDGTNMSVIPTVLLQTAGLASGSTFPIGITTNTFSATDASGNVATSSFTVTVTDIALPVITAPAAITLSCGASLLPLNTGAATATNNCNANIIITYSDDNAPGFCGGIITRTWKAATANNSSTAIQIITVSAAAVPTMTALAAITVDYGGLPNESQIVFNNALSGNCLISGLSNTSTFTTTPSTAGGTVTETWTATDICGRVINSVSRIITVNAAKLPVMIAPAATTISLACGASPQPSQIAYSNGLSGAGLISGTATSTLAIVPGTCRATFIETWTATDIYKRTLAPVSRTVTVSQNLGAVQSFVLFSAAGAVSNTGNSILTGDVGSNFGAVTGFNTPATLTGGVYIATATATQAKTDLLNLYIHLNNIPVTNITHAAVFGTETLKAGVYTISGAGSLTGNLTLNGQDINGQDNPNALFIIKLNGAFSPAAGSSITLTHGANASNVFWIAEGAISIGATATMKGTFIAHSGATSMGAGGDLEGRLLSTIGAVSFGPGKAYLPIGAGALPIICINENSNVTLGAAAAFTLFTSAGAVANIGTSGFIGNIGTGAGAITGFDAPSAIIYGSTYNTTNVLVDNAAKDLQTAYSNLISTTLKPKSVHTAVFGGETLTPGVYTVGSAATLAGTLILDGGNSLNAQFIFLINGAFSAAAQTNIVLINGANFSNVFWVAEGAISTGAFSFIKGSFIAHNGANTLGANSNLAGGLFSTGGAIGVNTGVAYNGYVNCSTPVAAVAKTSEKVILKTNISLLTDDKLSVYPNPARGVINLKVAGDGSKVTLVEITDVLGKVVYSSKHYQSTINLSNHVTGTYFIRVNNNSKITTTKVVMVR